MVDLTLKEKMQMLVNRALIAKDSKYAYPIKAPEILPGVVPAGKKAPVQVAMDAASPIYSPNANVGNVGFPGFQYLATLATRSEFRQMSSALATEMTREWLRFTCVSDDDNGAAQEKIKVIEEEFERFKVRDVIHAAVTHDAMFGRAQIFFDVRGADRSTPMILDPRTVPPGSFNGVRSVEAVWTTPSAYNALDPIAPDFYRPSHWWMLGQDVHASRLHTITTRPLPDILKPAFNFAGMSLYQLAEPYIDNWLRTRQSVSDLLFNFSITALKTDMSQALMAGMDDNQMDIIARAQLFTANRSNQGLMLLDNEKEEIVQINTPLSGLHELQAQAQEHMCATSRMPATVLTGIQPSGLNASSDGEMRAWYDWIRAQQQAYWSDPIRTILWLVQLSKFGEIDHSISFEWNPLYQMTEKERSEIENNQATRDSAYLDRGVLSAEEVRRALAGNPLNTYNGIDVEDVPEAPDPFDENNPQGNPFGDNPEDKPAEDKSVSEAQHRAMEAAAHGESTLGIPKKVGKEFVRKDAE